MPVVRRRMHANNGGCDVLAYLENGLSRGKNLATFSLTVEVLPFVVDPPLMALELEWLAVLFIPFGTETKRTAAQ